MYSAAGGKTPVTSSEELYLHGDKQNDECSFTATFKQLWIPGWAKINCAGPAVSRSFQTQTHLTFNFQQILWDHARKLTHKAVECLLSGYLFYSRGLVHSGV